MPIIAEFCQNHKGDPDILHGMIFDAADAGAKFAKIQSFFADDLSDSWKEDYDRVKKLELSWAEHEKFVKLCEKSGITPMTSVYTARYIQQVRNAGFKWVKIGSAQATNTELIKTYVTGGFKVIVSTGGHRLEDLVRLNLLAGVLHCVSKYPFSPNESDILRMIEIKNCWGNTPYGFSDHSDPMHPQWDLPAKVAMHLGATFIERHVTTLARNETKDGPVSINMTQLAELCRFDKLTMQDKLNEMPSLGLLSCPKDLQEKSLILRYSDRWKP